MALSPAATMAQKDMDTFLTEIGATAATDNTFRRYPLRTDRRYGQHTNYGTGRAGLLHVCSVCDSRSV
jgi:hypothetical protein